MNLYRKFILASAILSLFVVPLTALGADFFSGKSYLLAKDEMVGGNLYVGVEKADIRGRIGGDLVLVASDVSVTGPLVNDALIGGGTIKIMAPVEGDLRSIGGTITVTGRVGGDILVFGGQVAIESTASVAGDVIVYGGSVKILGPVSGGVRVIGGDVFINSAIAGNVLVQAERLNIGSSGVISGDLDYRSGNKNSLANEGKVLGKTNIKSDPILPEERQIGAFLGALASTWLVLRILMSVLGALVIYFLFRYRLTQAVGDSLARPWRSLLVGFVLAVVGPVLAIILLFSVLGMMFAGVLFLVYLVFALMAYILAGTYFGAWAYKLITKSSDFAVDWRTIILGTFGLAIVGFVPLVGWLLGLAFFLIALASLVERFYRLLTE